MSIKSLAFASAFAAGVAAAQAEPVEVKVGVLTDMTAFLSDAAGPGSVAAAELAAEDAAKLYPNLKIEIISADHQNKADVGSAVARRWFDEENVDLAIDLTNSAVGIAVFEVGKEKGKMTISPVGTSALTEKFCSETGVQWAMDTYTYTKAITKGIVDAGGNSWFFLTVDYSGGHALQAGMTGFIEAAGGTVAGSTLFPANNFDFGSYLLTAQSSGAEVIGIAAAGGDVINTIKQAGEFGITTSGQSLAAPTLFLTDIHALGLDKAKGVRFGSPFYWQMNEEAEAWSQRFFAKMNKMPTHAQAGVYTALLHYFKAVDLAGTDEGKAVAAKMKELPINDFMTKDGKVRVNGSVMRQRMLLEVKTPEESSGPWDYAKIISTLSTEDAAPKDLDKTGCDLVARN